MQWGVLDEERAGFIGRLVRLDDGRYELHRWTGKTYLAPSVFPSHEAAWKALTS